jgi:hypothetical protein
MAVTVPVNYWKIVQPQEYCDKTQKYGRLTADPTMALTECFLKRICWKVTFYGMPFS